MKVRTIIGLKTLIGFGPKISDSVAQMPEGLLRHENIMYSLFPPHVGMRQYWRDFGSLEKWTRSEPHRLWWTNFLKDSGGTGFWHESYFMRGGIEAIYDDVQMPFGLSSFAPTKLARGPMFSARTRSRIGGAETVISPVPEDEMYSDQDRKPAE
jgi:hypothetical protein